MINTQTHTHPLVQSIAKNAVSAGSKSGGKLNQHANIAGGSKLAPQRKVRTKIINGYPTKVI